MNTTRNITRTAALAATAALLVTASATLPGSSANARPDSDRLSSCQAPTQARPPVHAQPVAPRSSDHPPYLVRVRWALG